jgi:photosystem II stability/assembly factor-like uncharacterized protein
LCSIEKNFIKMKNITRLGFSVIIFLTSSFLFAGSHYWYRVPSPTTKWLNRCSFPDSVHGWVVGDSGVIIHTSNRGQTWVVQNSTIDFLIEDVFFLNERIGWGIANDFFYYGTTILKTTNGGVNWSASRYPDTTIVINTVYYTDSLTGFLGAFGGIVLQTTNGGASWLQTIVDTSACSFFPIRKFAFRDTIGLACGGIIDISGVAWRSTNSGLRWKGQCIAPEPIFFVMWLDSINAVGAGGDYEYGVSFVRSTDAGETWLYDTTGIFGVGQNIAYRTRADVWIPAGFSSRWAHSTDSTKTWDEVLSPDSSAIYATVFLDTLLGWSFGTGGAIYKFDTSLIGINYNQKNIPQETKLYQNYPNPFNPQTSIRFDVFRTARVRIVLYDLLGKELRVLTDDIRSPGNYTISFNSEGLSSGVYFYRIQAGKYFETKKLVVLK